MGVNPNTMPDDALAAATGDYRLLHLERLQPRTGRGGPGDLAWVWPALVMLAFPAVLLAVLVGAARRASKGR
jgi:hypothetical protein